MIFVKGPFSFSKMEQPTLRQLRNGRPPIWTLMDEELQFRSPERPGKIVCCTEHLPESAKAALAAETDRDPEWFPPQYIVTAQCERWRDNLTCSVFELDDDGSAFLEFQDIRPCGVCAFQQGIARVRAALYKRKVIDALIENWIAPRADGTCPYAEWSWRKMQVEMSLI